MSVKEMVAEYYRLRSQTTASSLEEFHSNPEVQSTLHRFRQSIAAQFGSQALNLSKEQIDLATALLGTTQTLLDQGNGAVIPPSHSTHVFGLIAKANRGQAPSQIMPVAPYVIPQFRRAELKRCRDIATGLPEVSTLKKVSSLVTDPSLRDLQIKVKNDVMKAWQHSSKLQQQYSGGNVRVVPQRPVRAMSAQLESSPYHSVRLKAQCDAFRLWYTTLRPAAQDRITSVARLTADINTKGLDLVKKRQARQMKMLRETDLVAYSRALDSDKLDKFLRIMKRTDDLLTEIGVKFAEAHDGVGVNKPSSNTSNRQHVFGNVEGSAAYDQMMTYTNNLNRNYEIVHKVKVDLKGVQPRLLQGGKLKSFQMVGLQWLISLFKNNINGILADLMGLGKTVQTISLLCHVIEQENMPGPHLVLCPLSLVQQWVEECSEWAPSLRVKAMELKDRGGLIPKLLYGGFQGIHTVCNDVMSKNFHGLDCLRQAVKGLPYANIVVVARNELSYTTAVGGARLEAVQWGYVIMDEGHAASNAKSKMTTRLHGLRSARRLLLTGTPMKNNIEELWSLLNYINPRIFDNSKEFLEVFTSPLRGVGGSDTQLTDDEREILILRLHQVIRPFMLRRTPQDTGEILPTKSTHRILCPMSALQTYLYKLADDNMEPFVTESGEPTLRRCFKKSSTQTLITSHPAAVDGFDDMWDSSTDTEGNVLIRCSGKFLGLDTILRRLHALGRKVVVFAQRLNIIELLETFMAFRGYSFVTLRGDTPRDERRLLLERFQGPDVFVFIASMKSGGQGVDGLQVANVGVFFDVDYTPANDEQAQHRLCRFGQKDHVRILYLTSSSDVEMRRFQISDAKRQNIQDVIHEGGYNLETVEGGDEKDEDDDDDDTENPHKAVAMDECLNNDITKLNTLLVRTQAEAHELSLRSEALVKCDLSLIDTWDAVPSDVKGALEQAVTNYQAMMNGQATENFGRGKRAREAFDEKISKQEIPLWRLDKYLDQGLSEEEAVQAWEALQKTKKGTALLKTIMPRAQYKKLLDFRVDATTKETLEDVLRVCTSVNAMREVLQRHQQVLTDSLGCSELLKELFKKLEL